MSLWVGLMILVSVPLVAALLIWAVPVWVCAQGEFRDERKGWALSIGLAMGLIGLKAASEGREVEVRLVVFRRPWLTLRRRRPSAGVPSTPRTVVQGQEERGPAHGNPEPDPGRRSGRTSPPGAEPPTGGRPRRGPKLGGSSQPAGVGAGPVTEGGGRPSFLSQVGRALGYVDRFRRPAGRFVGRLWRSFRIRRAACDLHFGAGDPATTGQLCGFLYAVRPLLGPRARIGVWPDFLVRRFEGTGSMVLSVSIARLTWAATFLAAGIGCPLGWDYLKKRWKGRRRLGKKPGGGEMGGGDLHHSEALIP